MNTADLTTLMRWLRAVGEPSRLRLLARCAEGALSVSDLARTLGQSEPRVSRHLKILREAGLITRLREGQWVEYRLAATPEAASFVRGLLAQADPADPVLSHDRSAARAGASPDPEPRGAESRIGRALAEFVRAERAANARGDALLVGVRHLELLETLAQRSRECIALAGARRAAQSARAFAERRAFPCRVIESSSPEGLSERDLRRAGASFATVLLDHPLSSPQRLARHLELVRGVLAPGGELWVFEHYESLESSRARIVEHPLARLRRVLGDAGFVCERLSPIESDGEHVLAALARAAAADHPRIARSGADAQ